MNKAGISPVISTVILTAVLMAVTIAAAMVSYDALRGQMAEMEFNAVKDEFRELAELLNRDSWIENTTHAVRVRCRFGGPMVVVTSDNLTVGVKSLINAFEPVNLTTLTNVTYLGYKSRYVTVGGEEYLVGNKSLVVNGDEVASVYTGLMRETLIRFDTLRVGVINAGNVSINGENWNYVVLRLIKLVKGLTGGAELFTIRWTTINVSSFTRLINTSLNNLTIVVYHSFFDRYGNLSYTVAEKTITLNPEANGTVVTVIVATVRVDVV